MKYGIVLIAFLIFSACCGSHAMAQGPTKANSSGETEVQWLWGEVSNLDPQNNLILVKYLDYETDQEKEITIGVDASTAYENVKTITDLKQNDPVSIDYTVTADGKNIARKVSFEKEEALSPDLEGVDAIAKKNLGIKEETPAAETTKPEEGKPQLPSD